MYTFYFYYENMYAYMLIHFLLTKNEFNKMDMEEMFKPFTKSEKDLSTLNLPLT